MGWRANAFFSKRSAAAELTALAQQVSTRANLPILSATTTPTTLPSVSPTHTVEAPAPTATSPVLVATTTETPQATATATAPPSPTATETETPLPSRTPLVHVVAKGDMLGALAARYGVSVGEIARSNDIAEDAVLSIDQRLIIPVTIAADSQATPQSSPEATEAPVPTTRPTALMPTPQPTASLPATFTPTPGLSLSGLAGLAAQQTLASPSSTPTPLMTPTSVIHIVEKGENLGRIAAKYSVTSARIAEANGITLTSVLSIGQKLVIPVNALAATVDPTAASAAEATTALNRTPLPTTTFTPTPASLSYTVQKGDTLGGIAVKHGVASEQIAAVNGLSLSAILQVGQSLRIPGAATPVNTATLEPTATLTLTPTPSPTLTRLPTPRFRYREPSLLWPTNGGAISGADLLPVLNWTSVGILGDDEWYCLRIWSPGQPEEPTEIFTKATSYRLTERAYPQGRRLQRFAWQVTVVSRAAEGGASLALSAPSAEYSFVWR